MEGQEDNDTVWQPFDKRHGWGNQSSLNWKGETFRKARTLAHDVRCDVRDRHFPCDDRGQGWYQRVEFYGQWMPPERKATCSQCERSGHGAGFLGGAVGAQAGSPAAECLALGGGRPGRGPASTYL